MVYQITVCSKSGDGASHYCTNPAIRDGLEAAMRRRHPDATVRVRVINSPNQDQTYQAEQNDIGWGRRDKYGNYVG